MSIALASLHVDRLERSLDELRHHLPVVERWGRQLAARLGVGGRLLVAGNGGSAAQAQHLTAELVGRFAGERRALSALSLHAETSSLTAIANDYGLERAFARQVEAHGRPGDVLLCLSTSGGSANVVTAARVARLSGLRTWALTGPGPNRLSDVCEEAVCVDVEATATVQELHLVAIHVVCGIVDDELGATA